jgi:hypothetical protein
MTTILYVSLFIIWLLGYVNAVQAFSSDETADTSTSRLAINVACALWPIAVCIAIVNILVKAVFGIGNKGSRKGIGKRKN